MKQVVFAILPWGFAFGIFYSWYLLLNKKNIGSLPIRYLYAFVLMLSQICGTSLLLGILRLYNSSFVYFINALVFFLLWIYSRSERGEWGYKKWLQDRSFQTKLLIFFVGIAFIWKIIIGIVLNDVSFDSMNYHLPWAAYAVQEEHFGPFDTPVPWINSYPKTLTLWYSWFLLSPGSDLLIDLAQLPFLVISIIAIYVILKRLQVDTKISIFSSLLLTFFPVVYQQASTNYIDLALAALVFTLFATALQKKQSYFTAIIFGLLCGLLLGGKATMLIPIFIASIVYLYSLYTQEELPKFSMPIRVFSIIGITLLFSGYWYIRNLIIYGDLLYPIEVAIGDFVLIPGVISPDELTAGSKPALLQQVSIFTSLFINSYQEVIPKYDMVPGGFGILWSMILLPIQPLILYLIIQKREWFRFFILSGFWVIWLLSPGNWWFRYTMTLSITGIVSYAILLTYMSEKQKQIMNGIMMTLCLISFSTMIWPFYADSDVFLKKLGSGILNQDFAYRYGDVYHSISDVTQQDSIIAYDGNWFTIYPMWNSRRTNTVIHIPFGLSWEERLHEQSVDHIVVKSDSPEFEYIQSRKNGFSYINSSDIYYLYEVK